MPDGKRRELRHFPADRRGTDLYGRSRAERTETNRTFYKKVMYTILEKRVLAENIYLMRIHAPRVARAAKPGQFIIVRIDEFGERVPPDHLRLRRRARLGNDRHAGYRSLDPQALCPGAGRCAGRFRRSAGAPLGVHS